MFEKTLIDKLKERYPEIHPLIFHRSVERAKSQGDLFDILEDFPRKYPVIWDENRHRWISTDDIFQYDTYQPEEKNDNKNTQT